MYEIDLSIARHVRGQGLGSVLLQQGVQALSQEYVQRPLLVKGIVHSTNTASSKAFVRAGFQECDSISAMLNFITAHNARAFCLSVD
ncbi:MAG: GNAT family N-acetyltransferase [Bacteroidota bacterium]|nr:GNAT family N-acetyltransferase [Bacteroidota bacterium]